MLIKNGLIIDGTGRPGYNSDILIEDDKIKKIEKDLETDGSKIIDATNKVIAPGFIDIHNHSDLTLLEHNDVDSFLKQGVTTLVVGMCGLGIAPANNKVKQYYFDFVSKAFTSTEIMFETLEDYFLAIEKKGISANFAFFIPQGNVRACVLGTDARAPSKDELNIMKDIVRENMEAGAFGLSTGLVYPPGSESSTEELIELSKVVSEYDGIYDSHMRNEGAGVIDIGMSELVEIARKANVKAHISHWSVISKYAYKITPEVIKYITDARKEGLKITADVVVYDNGSTSLTFILLSTWVFQNFKENLNNPKTRKKIANEVFEKLYQMFLADAPFHIKIIPKSIMRKLLFKGLAKRTKIFNVTYNHQVEGKSIYDALKMLYPKKKLEDALLDFIRDEDGGIMILVQTKDELKSIIPIFKQDFVCPSSDGFLVTEQNTHQRSYGAFARVLQRWVREMNVVPIEEAVRKMTSLPASILGLTDRGIIKEGYKADIVVFDPERVEEKGTFENGRQHPEGIEHVIVNGKLTIDKGKHLGVFNGQILKHKI